MSEDHKPNRADERQRIEEAGGVVVWAGTWRVGGVLAGGDIVLRYHKVYQPLHSQGRPVMHRWHEELPTQFADSVLGRAAVFNDVYF